MRTVWQGLALVAVIAAAALTALLIHPPASIVNSYAAQFGRDTLGRRVEVAGRTSLRALPTPRVRMEDVTIFNPPGTPGQAFVQAGIVEIDVSVGFWHVTPTAARIDGATLRLVRDASGRGNWEGLGAASAGGDATALGDVTITNGTLIYTEAGAGERMRLEALDLRLAQATPEAPLDVTFDTRIEKERLAGKARLAPVKTLMAGKPSPAAITVSASPGRAEIDGTIDPQAQKLTGKGRVEVPSLELLAAWLGVDAASIGQGALSFAGDIAISPASADTPASPASSSSAKPATETVSATPVPAGAVRLGISNASLTVTGKGDRKRLALEKIEASTAFASLAQPIEAAVDMTWNGERMDAQARVQSPDALLNRAKSAVSARFGTSRGRLEVQGDVLPGQAASFIGKAKGTTASLRTLARSVGFEPPLEGGLEAAAFEGDMSASMTSLKLWNARIKIDDTTARGTLSVESGPQRPVIGGKLTLDRLEADRYLPRSQSTVAATPATAQRPREPDRSSSSPARDPFAVIEFVPLTETLRSEIARLDGKTTVAATEAPLAASAAWSDEPVDLSGLKAADLDLELAIGEVKVGQRALAVPQLKTVVKDGRLTLDGKDVASHGGRINATAEIDASKGVPRLKAKLAADGVEFEQMFADAGLTPYLAGKANVEAEIAASGASQKAMVASLGGRVKAAAQKGAVIGWDLGTNWRSIFDGLRRGLGLQPYNGFARTPVETLTADIKIDEGVVNATAAQARGPHFAAVGEGRARLLTQQADYRGTFTTIVIPQLEVPFRASGPWTSAKPGLDPDRGGWGRVLLSLMGFGSGATLESAGGGAADGELTDLVREYVAKAEASGKLTGDDVETMRKLRELVGPPR